jgi:hypothetical protein
MKTLVAILTALFLVFGASAAEAAAPQDLAELARSVLERETPAAPSDAVGNESEGKLSKSSCCSQRFRCCRLR